MEERQLEREQELLDGLTTQQIAAIRSRVPPDRMGPEFCVECDNGIHIDRRMHGYSTCIECAMAREAMERRFK